MYYAMVFLTDPLTGLANVRSLKATPYRDIDTATAAIEKSGKEGYVKRVGHQIPVWHNVKIPMGDKRISQVLRG